MRKVNASRLKQVYHTDGASPLLFALFMSALEKKMSRVQERKVIGNDVNVHDWYITGNEKWRRHGKDNKKAETCMIQKRIKLDERKVQRQNRVK